MIEWCETGAETQGEADFTTDSTDFATYTADVLGFYRRHATELGSAFCEGARAVFSVPASSAACERVFSLLWRASLEVSL
eukprot:COSAG02_NODE_6141_length_3773_cov_1.478498_1_plen_80_part_00